MDALIWGLGLTVMMLGGLGIAAAVGWWAVDRVLRFWTNSTAIIRIMAHGREHGLDLANGKKIEPENLAH